MANITLQDKWDYQIKWIKEHVRYCPECYAEDLYVNTYTSHDGIPEVLIRCEDECPECEGEGTVECDACEHEIDCKDCEGTGHCDGCGWELSGTVSDVIKKLTMETTSE
jgi:hypothetical protein